MKIRKLSVVGRKVKKILRVLLPMLLLIAFWSTPPVSANRPVPQVLRFSDGGQEHISKIVYRISSIQEAKTIGEGLFLKEPDGKFVVVRFRISNSGKFAVPMDSVLRIALIDSRKKQWGPSIGVTGSLRIGTESFCLTELAPGEEVEDVVVFDVPDNIVDYSVRLPGGARVPRTSGRIPVAGVRKPEVEALKGPEIQKADAGVLPEKQADEVQDRTKNEAVSYGDGDRLDPTDPGAALQQDVFFYAVEKCDDYVAVYEKEINKMSEKGDQAGEAQFHYNAGQCYVQLAKYGSAARHFEDAAVIGRNIGSPELEVLALIGKSMALLGQGDKEEASAVFRTATEKADIDIFQDLWVSDYFKILVSFQMSMFLSEAGDKDKAREKIAHALLLNDDFGVEALILNELKKTDPKVLDGLNSFDILIREAWVLFEKRDYKSMVEAAEEALSEAKKIRYMKGIFAGEYAIAMGLHKSGDNKAAAGHVVRAEKLAKKGRDSNGLRLVYTLGGTILRQMWAYEKAMTYYDSYLALARKSGNKKEEASVLVMIAEVQMEKGAYRDALEYYRDALQLNIEAGAVNNTVVSGYLNVGRALKKVGDYAKAEKSLDLAGALFREFGNEEGELSALWEKADNYALQSDYESAIKLLEGNIERSKRYRIRTYFIDSLVSCAQEIGDTVRADRFRKLKAE